MRFRDMLSRHDGGKTAVIADGIRYSYEELARAVSETDEPEDGLWVIREKCVIDELIKFLAADKSVPLIAASDVPAYTEIPKNAGLAVMSSGSSGMPKLIFRTAASWTDFFDEQNRAFGIHGETTIFTNGSLCFSGTLNIVLGALYAGAAVILTSGGLTRRRMEYINEFCADAVYLIPDKLRVLCRSASVGGVRTVISGSQSMDAAEARRISAAIGAERVMLYYGASEVSYISYIDLLKEDRGRACVGLPFKGVETDCKDGYMRVVTDCGAIGIPMPYIMGDIIEQDDVGYLYFRGRHDDVLNIGGEKLSAAALEDEIRAAGAEDACVFSQKIGGRDILCCAYTGDGFDRSRLSHAPKRVYKLDEMPKNANGKTDRAKLIQECGAFLN